MDYMGRTAMGRTTRDDPDHKMMACGSWHSSAHTARLLGNILKIAYNLLGYAECMIPCIDYLLPDLVKEIGRAHV